MKLAMFGGTKVREKPFMSRPHINALERNYVNKCLDEKMFSRFVGSPTSNFRELLALPSSKVEELEEFWSVLGGPFVRKFEAEFARKHNVDFAISSNSATSSLISACIACGLSAEDEVITSPMSFTATSTAIRIAGPKVVFADVDRETFCLTVDSIKKRLTTKTKAVVVVHLLGNSGEIDLIHQFCKEMNLILIEDSAQALMTKKNNKFCGTWGAIGVFSFQETKNIMTGEGGMAITNDPLLAYKCRLIRNHGESMVFLPEDEDIIKAAVGYNFRLQEPLAAIGYAQAQKMEMLQEIRRQNGDYLANKLSMFNFLKKVKTTNDSGQFSPYCFGLTYSNAEIHRDTFALALRAEGIPVSTGFSRLLNENPITIESTDFTPNSLWLNYESYLGFFQVGYPNTKKDMDDIVTAVEKVSNNFDELKLNMPNSVSREYSTGRI